MKRQINIDFGAVSDEILVQLRAQEFVIDPRTADAWQRDADALIRLKIRGLVPESVANKGLQRLFNIIVKVVHADKDADVRQVKPA